MIEVTGFPRIHVALADLAGCTMRAFGGVGFSIDYHPIQLRVRACSQTQLIGFGAYDEASRRKFLSYVEGMLNRSAVSGVNIELVGGPRPHVGFGTGTATALAVLVGLDAELKLALPRSELQTLSGRGGASGIGIHAFFLGGLIADGGAPQRDKLIPSRYSSSGGFPPLLARLPIPPHWRIGLILPPGSAISGPDEAGFFEHNTPVPINEAYETIAAIYHGVLPALAESDVPALGKALRKLHHVGFKSREVARHPEVVKQLLTHLQERNWTAGMSSMGPLVYVITADSCSEREEEIYRTCHEHNALFIGWSRGRNEGFTIREVT